MVLHNLRNSHANEPESPVKAPFGLAYNLREVSLLPANKPVEHRRRQMKRFKQVTFSMILGLVALMLASQQARATVVFDDDFDSARSRSALNAQRLPNWSVFGGSVDVIKSGDYYVSCAGGSGFCIDLDGSTKSAGGIATHSIFGPGSYSLTFDISGNQRSFLGGMAEHGDAMIVSLGDWTQKLRMQADDSWKTVSIFFDTGVGGALSFSQLEMSYDYYGILLDNVVLTALSDTSSISNQLLDDDGRTQEVAVPEPAPWAVLLACLASLGLFTPRRNAYAA